MAGQVAGFVTDAALPTVQAGAHASAEAARTWAGDLSSPGALPAGSPEIAQQVLPGVLNAAASGLDVLASGAPAAKQALTYAADKAMPVVQNLLRASSQVSGDVAKADLPTEAEIAASLRSVNVDPDHLATQAQDVLQKAAAKVSERV